MLRQAVDSHIVTARWGVPLMRRRDFAESETPRFLGRALAALAADPERLRESGRVLSSWELARHYGIDDVDGRRPDWGAYAEKLGL